MKKKKSTKTPSAPTRLRLHLDEAGRGPLAGPVSVGCILALSTVDTTGFQDSKVLSEKTREVLYTKLGLLEKEGSITYHSGFSSNKDIDTRGIMRALQKASLRAIFFSLKKYFFFQWKSSLEQSVLKQDTIALPLLKKLFNTSTPTSKILKEIIHTQNSIATITTIIIDGNHTFGLDTALDIKVITIIKGDSKNPLISMASIIAKVERDQRVKKIAKQFPHYELERHKGYGTKKHRESIAIYGVSSFHRTSFCKNIQVNAKNKKLKAKKGVQLVPRVKKMKNRST